MLKLPENKSFEKVKKKKHFVTTMDYSKFILSFTLKTHYQHSRRFLVKYSTIPGTNVEARYSGVIKKRPRRVEERV